MGNIKDWAIAIGVFFALGLVIWLLFKARGLGSDIAAGAKKIGTGAKNIITKDINPASQENIINRGVNAATRAITGCEACTPGTLLFDGVQNVKKFLKQDKPAPRPDDPNRNDIPIEFQLPENVPEVDYWNDQGPDYPRVS